MNPQHAAIIDVFMRISSISKLRSDRWHKDGEENWSVLEWAGAMCGEAGEAANVAKKIKREMAGMLNGPNGTISAGSLEELDAKLAQECADTFLYLVLLAEHRGIDLGKAVIETFNAKSAQYGFPERL